MTHLTPWLLTALLLSGCSQTAGKDESTSDAGDDDTRLTWEGYDCQCEGPHGLCKDFNIDVNVDKVRIDDNGDIMLGGDTPICKSAVAADRPRDHGAIDSDEELLGVIEFIVRKKVVETTA